MRFSRLSLLVLLLFGCVISSFGQESASNPSRYITLFGGTSLKVLGSGDLRTDYGIGMAWQRPEPHFKWRHGPAQLVIEAYYEHSIGEDLGTRGRITDAVGVLWYGRFRFYSRGVNLFLDIGEGIQLDSSESHDLGTRLNSSPVFGFGVAFRQGKEELLLGIRWLHVSNAHLNDNNRGQNQVLVYTGFRF